MNGEDVKLTKMGGWITIAFHFEILKQGSFYFTGTAYHARSRSTDQNMVFTDLHTDNR